MWDFFLVNTRFAYLSLVALIVIGGYSLMEIPRESTPEVTIPIGIVTTILPGASALDVETLVTNEIEKGLTSLTNVSKLTSTSQSGVSSVVVEFDASANVDKSIQELKDEIDKIKPKLPTDAEDPAVSKINFVDQPILTAALSGNLTDQEFYDLSESLSDELESIAGISDVQFSGVVKPQTTVVVRQEDLLRYNLSILNVTDAIRGANTSFPSGEIINDGVKYGIAFEGDLKNVDEIKNIVVSNIGGQPVYLRDIALIDNGFASPNTISRASLEGKPSQTAITLNILKESGGDITHITKEVRARLDALSNNGGLLDDVDISIQQDSGELILKDLKNLGFSGLQTVALVILLLVIVIGWREALLAGLAIPLSFLFGFIGLYFSGNTINFLSLFALILGIGILVDSAIVMVEGINRKLKEDLTIDKELAARETIFEFKSPLISGNLTTIGMFVGLFIVSGIIGQFIASIPFTLIFILFASIFVSLAYIPLFAAHFLRRRNTTKMEQLQHYYTHKLEEKYRSFLSRIVGNKQKERRFMWLIRIALVIALILPIVGVVKVVFFEVSDVDYLIVEIETNEGTTKEVTDIATLRAEEVLYNIPEIESFITTTGNGSAYASGGSSEKLANIFINLKTDRERTSTEIQEEIRPLLAGIKTAKVTITQPSDGPPTGAAIVIKYLGDDTEELNELARQTTLLMDGMSEITNIAASNNNSATEFVLDLDRAKAAALGLSPASISQVIRTALYGNEVTSITSLSSDIPVVIKLLIDPSNEEGVANTNYATIDDLTRIEIQTKTGKVPLSNLVNVSLREAQSSISHEEKKRVVSITADVTAGANAREVQAELIKKVKGELSIPPSVTLSTGGGESEESNKAFMEMLLALIVGIILMLTVLVLQFNSFLHTKYVLSILPYSLIGIMFGLAVTQNALSFPSIMGFIALSGIVVNNSILLIDMMNQMRIKQPTKSIKDVVIDSATNRLRPILLTTTTTVIGMIPLIYAGGLWAPLAYAVMFGLLFSVVITLVLIPITYNKRPV